MACIFRQHKALGVIHVGNTACARVSRSTHELNHFVQLFLVTTLSSLHSTLLFRWAVFIFKKSPQEYQPSGTHVA